MSVSWAERSQKIQSECQISTPRPQGIPSRHERQQLEDGSASRNRFLYDEGNKQGRVSARDEEARLRYGVDSRKEIYYVYLPNTKRKRMQSP